MNSVYPLWGWNTWWALIGQDCQLHSHYKLSLSGGSNSTVSPVGGRLWPNPALSYECSFYRKYCWVCCTAFWWMWSLSFWACAGFIPAQAGPPNEYLRVSISVIFNHENSIPNKTRWLPYLDNCHTDTDPQNYSTVVQQPFLHGGYTTLQQITWNREQMGLRKRWREEGRGGFRVTGREMNECVIPAGHAQSLYKAQLLALDGVSEGKNNRVSLSWETVKFLKHADQTAEQWRVFFLVFEQIAECKQLASAVSDHCADCVRPRCRSELTARVTQLSQTEICNDLKACALSKHPPAEETPLKDGRGQDWNIKPDESECVDSSYQKTVRIISDYEYCYGTSLTGNLLNYEIVTLKCST